MAQPVSSRLTGMSVMSVRSVRAMRGGFIMPLGHQVTGFADVQSCHGHGPTVTVHLVRQHITAPGELRKMNNQSQGCVMASRL
jgi:hypothetical protein